MKNNLKESKVYFWNGTCFNSLSGFLQIDGIVSIKVYTRQTPNYSHFIWPTDHGQPNADEPEPI